MVADTRRWDLIGLAAGAAVGVAEVSLFVALGATMEIGGYDVSVVTLATFAIAYAVLGFAAGRLAMARTRAREDADTISAQLDELESTQRALVEQEKLAAIGSLAAGIAHEVRNPLGVIRASATVARDAINENEQGGDPDALRACDFVRDETDRLDGLITSLLSFARPTRADVAPVSVTEVVDRALALAAPELEKRSIGASADIDSDARSVTVDGDLIAQAVYDLLLNAAEALESGGRVAVRASRRNGSVVIEVADDGPGVDPENAPRVFDPFFTTKASGTGLGLAMVARIVEAHGGELRCLEGEGIGPGGGGACFSIALPQGMEAGS